MKCFRMVMLLALVGCGGAYDAGTSSGGPPSGSVSFGGGADFGAFRRALDDGKVPATESIEASGFFAEHYTSLPAATCEGRLCLHAMLSVTPDLVHGDTETLVQIGVNTPLNPETFPRPPLDLVVVVDRSGSMAGADKMTYAKQGLVQLVDQLGP